MSMDGVNVEEWLLIASQTALQNPRREIRNVVSDRQRRRMEARADMKREYGEWDKERVEAIAAEEEQAQGLKELNTQMQKCEEQWEKQLQEVNDTPFTFLQMKEKRRERRRVENAVAEEKHEKIRETELKIASLARKVKETRDAEHTRWKQELAAARESLIGSDRSPYYGHREKMLDAKNAERHRDHCMVAQRCQYWERLCDDCKDDLWHFCAQMLRGS